MRAMLIELVNKSILMACQEGDQLKAKQLITSTVQIQTYPIPDSTDRFHASVILRDVKKLVPEGIHASAIIGEVAAIVDDQRAEKRARKA